MPFLFLHRISVVRVYLSIAATAHGSHRPESTSIGQPLSSQAGSQSNLATPVMAKFAFFSNDTLAGRCQQRKTPKDEISAPKVMRGDHGHAD